MRRTKIVCTLGPASNNEAVMEAMLKNGMNVARLNFSHGTHEQHAETIDRFRKVRDRLNVSAAVMLDTKGPEIRIRLMKDGGADLINGSPFVLTTRDIEGTASIASVTYEDLPAQMQPGYRILIDDGKIQLRVDSVEDTEINCTVLAGGELRSRKSINVPMVSLDMPYISEQDKKDILFGIEKDVDFIAASFVRRADDVIALRKLLDYHGGHDIRIIAKIENIEGVNNFDEILHEADGIMVARGDMGVEVDFEKLPGIQKRFIRKCYQSGKMVITATQMLESMIESPMPTRAEISDVANAVFDGTSAVMLSGETAMGVDPAHVVNYMAKIVRQADKEAVELNAFRGIKHEIDFSDISNAICDAACTTAKDMNASAILVVTKTGRTARRVSKFRPAEVIVAATPENKTFHQLALSWGIEPVLALNQVDNDRLFQHAIDCAKQNDLVTKGDRVVIVAGMPITEHTNSLRVFNI
ncbi:MAG: pyruvate kinase [Ruminococcaceae bacterium]|nr:pyruvate kinase [Oscillospiraceae bacterium]